MVQTSFHKQFKCLAMVLGCFSAFFSNGCAQDTLYSVQYATEEFIQETESEVDILWVVDNSSSMALNQEGIGQSFQAFIDNLLATNVDYHIGVVSTDVRDQGVLHRSPSGAPFITSATTDPGGSFLQNVRVGITGSATERSFEVAALALGKGRSWLPNQPVSPPNPGFLRDEASLFLIMLSDEDDKSFGPVSYYRKLFESYKGAGNESRISVSAIVGDPGEGCFEATRGDAQPGERYIDLASQTGGVFSSICSDFADTLRGLSISATGLRSRFELNSIPNQAARIACGSLSELDALCVKVNGTPVAKGNTRQGWRYDERTNSVLFGADSIPAPRATITVKYQELNR